MGLTLLVTLPLAACSGGGGAGGGPAFPALGGSGSAAIPNGPVPLGPTAAPTAPGAAASNAAPAPGSPANPHPSQPLPPSQPPGAAHGGPTPLPPPAPIVTSAPPPGHTPAPPPVQTPAPPPAQTPAPPPVQTANVCQHFRSNPMCSPLPSNKSVSPNSSSWSSLLFQPGRDTIQGIEVTVDPSDINDGNEPLFPLVAGQPSYRETIACDVVSWSSWVCGLTNQNDTVISVPTNMRPAGNSDHHASIADYTRGGEEDFWLLSRDVLVEGGTLHVGGGGFCPWSGDGTNCSGSTATRLATSLGGIDPIDVRNAERSPNGTLPYALSVTALCADPSSVWPATASDGSNTDTTPACFGHTGSGQRPPEGTRVYLDKNDAEINMTNNAPYVKTILRTMDRDHLGMTITDTNWAGGPGLAPQYRRGDWAFAEVEAGLPTSGTVLLPITTNGIDLRSDVKFCSNGTC